jgi:hypothetical protein
MLAYMILTANVDKILAPRQRRPRPTLTAATSRAPLTRKKKHSHHVYLPTRISSQANEQHRKSHLTIQLPRAKHAHSQTRELQILPSGETQIARKRRKTKQREEEAARRQTLTRGRVTRPDHSTNYG